MSVTIRQTPEEVLTIVTSLSGIPLDTLQSPTQLRSVGQVRAAAAHLLRTHCRLPVKDVAPLLARSDQTVCECSRKARLALVTGGRIAELIEQTRVVLDDGAADTSAPHTAEAESRDGETVDRAAIYADPSPVPAPRSIPAISLRRWRTQAGLTQPQLGARAGVARETIARIENGRPATRPVVFRLAEALQIAPSMLTGITDLDTLTGETYKTCNRCAAVKPLAGFIRIKDTPRVYLRCRACRARDARERYYRTPEIHEAEKARARENGRIRRLSRHLGTTQAIGEADSPWYRRDKPACFPVSHGSANANDPVKAPDGLRRIESSK